MGTITHFRNITAGRSKSANLKILVIILRVYSIFCALMNIFGTICFCLIGVFNGFEFLTFFTFYLEPLFGVEFVTKKRLIEKFSIEAF